ncbi:MAG: IgGFc-binding protein [Deltaproteobacteria bacterium]|nr:IgGFc-binding protein [Deltaproteobacteria bacterium]
MKRVSLLIIGALLVWSWAAGCNPADSKSSDDDDEDAGTDTDTDTDTDSDTDTGDALACEPGEIWCFENWIAECNAAGDGWNQLEDCEELGLVCAAGECVDISQECADAINEKSYIGCEYWATTLSNRTINKDSYDNPLPGEPFTFAVAIANDGENDAAVHITDGSLVANDYVVPGGEMIVIEDLPWKKGIKDAYEFSYSGSTYYTRKVANSAYRITSDQPITAYQFNPLDYCVGACAEQDDFSFTNDASLLLPVHVLRDEYIVISRPTMRVDFGTSVLDSPGFFAVVGTGTEPAELEISFTAHTLPSDALSNEDYPPYEPGFIVPEIVIQPHEVLQFMSGSAPTDDCPNPTTCGTEDYTCCETQPDYDLTGSVIKVLSGPAPAVFAGHDCTFVPFDKWACDHLEQQMFPLETWGQRYLCGRNVPQDLDDDTVWRVVSGSDANEINFEPSEVYPNIVLNKGEYVEFLTKENFEVTGDGRLAVAQFMVGQNYTSSAQFGDPAMALGVPVEQYRESYTFLAPESYVYNFLTVVHLTEAEVELDGDSIPQTSLAINDEWSRTNFTIQGGIHYIEAGSPFMINVHGVGQYTSYMYPGGLDLAKIDVVE